MAVENEAYFKRYLSLIERYAGQAQTVLDAGCGTGLSSCLLSRNHKQVVGVDLSELFLRRGSRENLRENLLLAAADILHLPFPDESFDLVSSYLVLEFLPDVERGLMEMIRVLGRGGMLLIVTPNHLSPIWPMRDFFRMLAGGPPRPVWCETPRAAFATFWRNLCLSTKKTFERECEFLYREPDLTCRHVVGRDSDSVYLANPMDLAGFLKQKGFQILRTGSRSTLLEKLFPFFCVGVEIVAKKVDRNAS